LSPAHAGPADIDTLLDRGVWNGYQKALLLLTAIAVIFDGFDLQVLGLAIPSIMREWHVTRAAFAPIAALGLAGMVVGSSLAGYCGDRFGRRVTLIVCVLVFGLATLATSFCHSLLILGILRVIAGTGVGGALPNAAALTAEFAPLRRRALAVTLTLICVPLGGMAAGLIASVVLPALGWRALYVIGGAAPLLFAMLMFAALPESPRFLMRLPGRRDELVRILGRMGCPSDALAATDPASARQGEALKGAGSALRSLFAPALRRDTLGLWLAFFACLNGIYLVFGWLPSMLTSQGLNIATASSALAAYNFGGVLGVLICAAIVTAIGSRGLLLWGAAAGAVTALALMLVHIAPAGGHQLLVAGIGLQGLFANAVQTTMFALAAHVYPTRMRASGVAWAASVGRVGGLVSSLGGAAIIQAGSGAYLGVLAIAMMFTFLGLAAVRNHCPGRNVAH